MSLQKEKLIKDGWIETALGEVAEIVTDYVANGSFASLKENVTYLKNGYARLIRLVDHNRKYSDDAIFVSEDSYNFLKKSKLFPNDIVISNVGEYSGTVFRVPNLNIPMTLGPNAILIRFGDSNDFMYYFLTSPLGQHLVNSIKSGSANPKFNKTDFKSIKFLLPPFPEQQAIASVLSAFDDKIELLREENKTLEEIGKTIFKEWFGKYSVERPEELPDGWRVGNLGEVATIDWGNTNMTKSSYMDKGNFLAVSAAGCDGLVNHSEHQYGAFVISAIGENCGKLFMPSGDFTAIKNTLVVKQKDFNTSFYSYFGLFVWSLPKRGAAQPFISKGDTESFEIIIPDSSFIFKFETICKNLFAKIRNNSEQIQSLSNSRDELLPKLMRGEVRVK